MKSLKLALIASTSLFSVNALATDLEVTHWWTSGGEAAAVAELAKAFDATGNNWVDGAIAGSSGAALPIITSRIAGGDPMGATQLNHGQQAAELIEAGLMLDLTDVAEANGWKDVINPPSLLEACTSDGKIFCAPLNIHSPQWLWLSAQAYADAGVDVPTNWNEFVDSAPALVEAGKVPLAMGQQPWQTSLAFNVLFIGLVGEDTYLKVYKDHDAEVAAGPDVKKAFEAADKARELSKDSNVQDWNQATNMVITGQAGGQIMGDWAQGEFQVAGQVAGEDYFCLPGLGVNEFITTGGDAFYFPVIEDDATVEAQKTLAQTLLTPETQVAFNLKKGSLPVRSDVNLDDANDCMKKGLDILAAGNVVPDVPQLLDPDSVTQTHDLFVQFFNDPQMTAEEAQTLFAGIIEKAE